MRPMNLGSGVSRTQWENENETRAYPFLPETVPDGFPVGVVVDMSVVVTGESAPEVRLSSVHVGPGMVSASVRGASFSAVCSVPRSGFEPYRPYPLSAVSGTCAGMCSFGDVDFSSPFTAKFGGSGPVLLGCLVAAVPTPRLLSFVDDASGDEVSGDVEIIVPSGLSVERSDDPGGGIRVQRLSLSMDDSLDRITTSPCEASKGEEYAGRVSPLRSINGVLPDGRGRIAVVFE